MSDDQYRDAVMRQMAHAQNAMRVNRAGWTDDDWIEDARRLMNDIDGAVTSLVNGHVLAMLRRLGEQTNEQDHPGRPASEASPCRWRSHLRPCHSRGFDRSRRIHRRGDSLPTRRHQAPDAGVGTAEARGAERSWRVGSSRR